MMMKRSIYFLLFFLSACGGSPEKPQDDVLLPMIQPAAGFMGLSDVILKSAVKEYLAKNGAPSYSRYNFTRIDLNSDGSQDALVYLTAPYGQWCDYSGCTVLVMEAADSGFKIAGKIAGVQSPLYISQDHQYKQWKDIVVTVAPEREPAKTVALVYNGIHYPKSSQTALDAPPVNVKGYQRIFP